MGHGISFGNNETRFRATCEEAKYLDAKRAVELGLKACERSKWKAYAYVDTLAAAHAEAGNFAEAVRWQKRAIEIAPKSSRKEMTERLVLFEAHKPYREPPKVAAVANKAN